MNDSPEHMLYSLGGIATRAFMRLSPHRFLTALLLLRPATLTAEPQPDGWFQFRGPTRDGHSSETVLVRSWPAEGPPELWRRPIGPGFSGLSIVAGRVFTMGRRVRSVVLTLAPEPGR